MGIDWKQWAARKGLQKWFRKDNFIILVLMGILLVIIALPSKEDGGKIADGISGAQGGGTASEGMTAEGPDGKGGTGGEADAEEYATYLEKRLTEALSRMENVGKVEVMITLKSSRELVVEKEEPVSRSSTDEKDSQGGSRTVRETESEENTVYRTEGSASEPYVIKTLPPQIEGVLVVAEGAGRGTVNRTIVEIAQALFGVEAHKVKVVKMGTAQEDEM